MKKRLLSLLLVLTMLVGLLPMAVFAAEETLPEIPEDIAKATELDVDDLTFALNFGFNLEGLTEEQQNALFEAYQNYYIDFELAVNSKVTFKADSKNADGYLAGSYGAYNSGAWVKVPVSDVTLGAGESIRIMEYAAKAYKSNGLYQTLANIYSVVNSFNCGVFFTEKFLTANPDLVVTLKLNAYEPVEGADSPYGEAITLGTYTFTNPKKTVVVEIQNNTALDEDGYAPVEGVDGVEKLSVTLAIVELSGDGVAKITYSVEPLDANGNKVSEPSTPIKFRLPIPASVTETQAKVYHEGEYMGTYPIVGEGNGKYVEVTSANFSNFDVVPTNEEHVENVAQIGTQGFKTLAEAFAAAQDGDTITLLSDLAIDTETYTIADGVSINLDMNGKKLTVTDNATANYELFYIYGGMTVYGNGTIELTSTNDRDWNAMSAIFHNRGGVLTIKNGTFRNLGGTDMAWVVDNSGNYYGDATTNIEGGTLTSTYTAIRNRMEQNSHGASGTAYLNISGGSINGTTSAIWAQAASTSTTSPATGEINISGGEIGLVNTARSTGAECMTTISGGTVAGVKCEVGELTVTGEGKITGNITILTATGDETDYAVDANGQYVTAAAAIGTKGFVSLQAAIVAAQDGDTITVLKDINLASTETTLLDNSYDTYFLVEGKSVTIDLNGKTISGAYAGSKMLVGVFSTDNNGHLTLVDSSELKTATVNVTAGGTVYSLIANYESGCSITINGGSYSLDKAGDSMIYSGCSVGEGEGVTVNAGSFTLGNVNTGSNGKPWMFNCLGSNERHAWVIGGTFNANVFDQYWRHEVQCGGLYAAKDNGDGTWTVVPAEAYIAEDENGYDYYVGYATLAEAVNAVKADETVTLVKDIEVEKSIAITGNRNVTIDLNGHTLSSAKAHVITCYYNNTTITIKDSVGGGKVLTNGSGKHAFVVQSNLVIDGAEISSDKGGNAIVAQRANANVTIQNNSVINGKIVVKAGKLTIENGTFKNKLEITDGVTVSITGGTFVQEIPDEWCIDYYGSVDNGDGTWTVKFVKFVLNETTGEAYRTVAEAIAAIGKDAGTQELKLLGDVTVKGQFIGHSYAQKVVIDLNGHKMSSTDKALTVYRSGTEVTIKNGTVHGNTTGGTIQVTYGGKLILGENVTITSGGSANALKVDDNSTLIIAEDSAKVLGGLASRGRYDITASSKAIIEISAGNFGQPVKAEWCAEGYMPDPFQHEDGTYGVMEWKAAMIDGVFYDTLQEAIAAAKDGETVTVLSNLELDWDDVVMTTESGYAVLLSVEGKSITLDLNGKTISVTHTATEEAERIYAVVYVADGASLTVTGNGSIDVTANTTTPRVAYMFWKRGTTGSLTIENGSFHMNDSEDSMVYTNGNEIVTVKGGTFILDSVGTRVNGSPWIFNVKGAGDHHVIVTGGTFNFNIQRQHWANEVMVPGTYYVEKNEGKTWTVHSGAALYVNEGILTGPFYVENWFIGYASLEAFYDAADADPTDTIDRDDPITSLTN